jgi:subtilisin family serine protease
MTNYLIDFVDDTTLPEMTEYFTEHNCTLVTCFDKFHNTCHVTSATLPPTTSIVSLVQDDDVSPVKLLAVVPVTVVAPSNNVFITNDEPNWWKVYSLRSVDITSTSWTIPVFGDNVNVYVMDSGIDISHPEFLNKNVDLLYSFTGEYSDTKGHGTALSSVIIGNTCGLTNATLKVVKVFDATQPTKQSDFLYAFDAIYQDSITSPNKFSVVNLSWSIARNSYIEQKIDVLIRAGVLVVAASGNSGLPIADVTPAAMPNVLTIGSYGIEFIPSSFSDYSDSGISVTPAAVNQGMLDGWAPGENIWCALVGGAYGYASGTSLSAAIYSAGIAYNCSQRLTETNNLGSSRRNPDNTVLLQAITSKDRIGLLNLADPKYSTSENKICTYLNEREFVPMVPNQLPIRFTVEVGKVNTLILFFPTLTASYELLGPLPAYCNIEGSSIFAAPKTSDGPVSPEQYLTTDIPYKVNLLDGTSYTTTVTVVVLAANFSTANVPPDDPVIGYTLLTACTGRFSCSVRSCSVSWSACVSGAKSNCECLSM